MTIEEVGLALEAHNPRMSVGNTKMPKSTRSDFGGFTMEMVANWSMGIKGFINDGSEPSDKIIVVFSSPPSVQKAVLITRELTYGTNKGPARSVMLDALTEKYGEASYFNEQYGVRALIWSTENPEYSDNENKYYSNYIRSLLIKSKPYLSLSSLVGPQPLIGDPGAALKVTVVTPKQSVSQVTSVLLESLTKIAGYNIATREMRMDLREKRTAEYLEQAQQKSAPKL